ncbi:transcriptional regulator, TrmB [Methanolacinia petrolearia DSM 11571]|uniref:Transcriptional regulator, TrmB n=1 Tax=Methanolacinia petrolearia (strain DSM 11571 / OCM 486 / SEBR 4847) TaxID=679926 RepID=E1RFN6_METP4|nr:helix-turn-helix domain-containing protein [Methanolacinia petrolearia]ADN37340.1 transcriptional regulator, TrmB [Methanolacinia petrolearia DSM 11571]
MNPGKEKSGQLIEALKSLGLTKYEALVYIGLLQFEGASATEIHEISGVPRASVYPVLDKLSHKGLVIVSNSIPKRFEAVPPEEGIIKLKEDIELNAEYASSELQRIYISKMTPEKERQELIWTLSGHENIINKLKLSISDAKSKIQIVADRDFIKKQLEETLFRLEQKIQIEIITDQWPDEVPKGTIIRIIEDKLCECLETQYEMAGIYIIDSRKVMVIMSSPGNDPSALFSESNGFISFFTNYWKFVSYHLDKKRPVKCIQG